MATTGRYVSRVDRALRTLPGTATGGRLSATVTVQLQGVPSLSTGTATPSFELMGPGDVERLAPGTILRRYPAPGSGDAEVNKLPLVEFSTSDLPWRYTPTGPTGPQLRPWLVLVAGLPGTDGIALRPNGTVRISTAVQNSHKLVNSWAWAHVHRVGTFERSRLMSPLDSDLLVETRYIAALVPGFNPDGSDAWSESEAGPVVLPCYDSWEFRTGPEGDFPSLARKLRRTDLADLALRGGRPFGRADLAYDPRSGGPPVMLSAAGALRVPAETTPDPADGPPPAHVASDVAALLTPIIAPDGRDVVTVPEYAAAFLPMDAPPGSSGWPTQLAHDPRLRGAAGLGAWTAIAWQNRIADAAALKLGDTVLAAESIRALALGVAASRSLWNRRVPSDPVAALVVLAPALGRLPTDVAGGRNTVLAVLANRYQPETAGEPQTLQLAPALFSSAARRAARPGPARAARLGSAAADLAGLILLAAGCPDPTEQPDVLSWVEPDPTADPVAAASDAIYAATYDPVLAGEVINIVLADGAVDPAWLAAVLAAMQPGPDGQVDQDALNRVLDARDHPPLPEPDRSWEEGPDEHAPNCIALDLPRLGQAVREAIDPTVSLPPAARRIFETLPGINSMRPLEVEPELDIPLWSFLSSASPDWMLPGVGDLAEHEVVGVETNPSFVQALLLGANWQAAGELRWRNVPLVPRSSPLRRFWQRAPGKPPAGSPDDVYDIRPIRFWPTATPIGSASLAATPREAEAVVVFKSPIFSRYPTTVVYLYDARPTAGAAPDWDNPPEKDSPLAKPRRVDFVFTGTIGPTVTFFGFPVPASVLANHWVVLEEPPAGFRFTQTVRNDVTVTEAHSGHFAHRRFAIPVRVLLGPLL